jgi:PAS domain S-box-containing protein
MWHIATPIMVGEQQVGNIFSGQFFFDDEPLDYELFRSQARKYGFDEEEYIAALEKVPLLSREAVDTGMAFLTKLAHMLSQLSYSNIKLSRSVAEHDALVDALQESEEKYRNIVETANEGIWIFNSVSETIYVNEKIAEMLGYGREEIVGSFIWDYADEGDKGFFQVKLANRKQGIDEVYECKLLCKNGSPVWLLVSAKASFDKDSKFVGSLGMFTDITERKRAEEEVQGTRNMLQLIMNNIPQGIFWKDRNSRYMGCNKVFAKATGVVSPENIVGKTDYDLPWSPEQTELFHEYDCRIMENGIPQYHIVESQLEADEELAWVETNKIPLHDGKGNVIGILGTYEDITERKKAEEALRFSNLYNRSLIEASLDPLVTIGRDGKIKDVNGATEQVTGYSRNDLIGTDFSDYFTEPEKARTGYKQVFTDGKVWDYPLEIQHKDGHITPVLYNASVYRDENGEVIGVFAAARDITERKKAEEALKKTYDNLERLVEKRTTQLEKAYKSLKESEKSLAEAQKIAHIGKTGNGIL